ncbi:YfcC family protein [Bifidobacterium sp. ESL0690]|uniref:YfcC family protein n=1 Tax=Bifidobacterium sp. ESL0690 TaxID=2983214 RepID=UPI0023F9C908|nr:YfcC family protein [Bifidobacterium sp. ESL0690]WEV47380.1 YfcC family protein [Bifidobacterium sp. ESL0690]
MSQTTVAKSDEKKDVKPKRRKSMPNTYVILFLIIVVIAVLTWFVPGGAYKADATGHAISGTYHSVKSTPQGIWDMLMAPITGMLGSKTIDPAIPISLFIMLFGSFLEMMEESGALKIGLRKIAIASQKKLLLLIVALTSIMSVLGTIEGAYEEGIVYLLMFLPLLLAMGLDTVTGTMIIVLGTQAGCLASTINPFATGIASGIARISVGDGLGLRVIMLIVFTALVSFLIFTYAKRVQKDPSRSMQYYRRDKDLELFPTAEDDSHLSLTGAQKASLWLFVATFVIMVISLIPWTGLNSKWTFFETFATWIGKTPVLRVLLGSDITPFGSWYFAELSMLLLVMSFIIGKVMGYTTDKIVNIIIHGASGLVSTALIVAMARGIQVVMDDGQITPTILHMGESSLAALPPIAFMIVSLIFYTLIACLIPSSTGLAAATMAIMASLAGFAHVPAALMVTIYCMALGLAKMVTPTSIVLMTCLQAAHISYGKWIRFIAPYWAIIFGACCVILVIAALI